MSVFFICISGCNSEIDVKQYILKPVNSNVCVIFINLYLSKYKNTRIKNLWAQKYRCATYFRQKWSEKLKPHRDTCIVQLKHALTSHDSNQMDDELFIACSFNKQISFMSHVGYDCPFYRIRPSVHQIS